MFDFQQYCDAVDTGHNVDGVVVTRDFKDHGFSISEFNVMEGYFPNWLFYNVDSEKSPYIMILYTPNNLDGDMQFKVFGARYEERHNGFDEWETGIELVTNG